MYILSYVLKRYIHAEIAQMRGHLTLSIYKVEFTDQQQNIGKHFGYTRSLFFHLRWF